MLTEDFKYYLKESLGGNKRAFEKIAEALSARVTAIAFRILRDRHLSEDVLNTVLFTVWQNLEKLSGLKNPLGYIHTVAYNAALDIKRKERALPLIEERCGEAVPDLEARFDIDSALSRLSDEERTLVMYKVHGGYSFKETRLTGLTKKAAYLRYRKAAQKLKEYLY